MGRPGGAYFKWTHRRAKNRGLGNLKGEVPHGEATHEESERGVPGNEWDPWN